MLKNWAIHTKGYENRNTKKNPQKRKFQENRGQSFRPLYLESQDLKIWKKKESERGKWKMRQEREIERNRKEDGGAVKAVSYCYWM